MERITYKSEHGGYGYSKDIDLFANDTKNYVGKLEDEAENLCHSCDQCEIEVSGKCVDEDGNMGEFKEDKNE